MTRQDLAESMGFLYVASGPMVRSSYRAGEFYLANVLRGKQHSGQEPVADALSANRAGSIGGVEDRGPAAAVAAVGQ
jgi:lipoyl synthase